MPPEELTLILKLRDEATAQLKSVKGTITAIGGAMIATGLKVGAAWATATKTLVDGTGATGPALKQLQTDFQAVAKHGEPAATAIADLNTHLGLVGPELVKVADAALKMGVNTSSLGSVLEQTGGNLEDHLQLMNDITVAAQATGVSQDQLLDTVAKNSARWKEAGGDVKDLVAHVTELAQEFGPKGLRGAMSETMAEVDTGVIPSITSLRDQFGETSTAIEDTFAASYTWRDVLGEMKNAAIAYLGPAGDMLAAVGAMSVGLVQVIPLIKGTAIAQRLLNVAMRLNPIGLIVTAIVAAGAAIWVWRDQIMGFLGGAWNAFVGAIEAGIEFLRPMAEFVGIDMPEGLDSWKIAQEDVTTALESAGPAVEVLGDATGDLVVDMTAAAPAVAAVKEEIEAFDLSTVSLTNQLQQVKPAITDIGDLLDASGVSAGTGAVAWGFYADEVGTKVPSALDMVMDSMLELPPTADEVSQHLREAAPTWGQNMIDGLKSVWNPTNVGATLARAFESGGGMIAAAKSLGAQAGTVITSELSTAAQGIGGVLGNLMSFAAPLAIPAAVALGKKIWSGITGAFGGPSEEVQAARGDLDLFANEVEGYVGQTASSTERLNDFITHGWEKNRAVVITYFQDQALASGRSLEDAEAHWLAYQAAIEAGNVELAASLAQQAVDWAEATGEAATAAAEAWAETYTAQTATSSEATDEAIANTERMRDSMVDAAVLILASWQEMAAGLAESMQAASAAITAALAAIPEQKVITITTVGGARLSMASALPAARRRQAARTSWESAARSTSRRHGPDTCPAMAGASDNARRIGREVAKALQESPISIPQDAVTDSVLRAAPGREALRGWA